MLVENTVSDKNQIPYYSIGLGNFFFNFGNYSICFLYLRSLQLTMLRVSTFTQHLNHFHPHIASQ